MTAVDLDEPQILGKASALTTVTDGLMVGYENALRRLTESIGEQPFDKRLACSSAAGGLKIVAIGLVPELTVSAAKQAALGAGGRVVGVFSHQISSVDLEALQALNPDLILLAGGTDGGEWQTLDHNSRMLAESELTVPIVLAGNRSAAPKAESTLIQAGKTVYRVENVLPELGKLNIEPAQQAIRELFFKRIIKAKGLDQVERLIDGITMPTPAAAQAAARLLADGDGKQPGLGELMLIDIGGATTDVHSIAHGFPVQATVGLRGLPEPRVKRTVEGDLGMRYSAPAVMELYSPEFIARLTGLPELVVNEGIKRRAVEVGFLPKTEADWRLEGNLGFLAVKAAVTRHAGRIERYFSPAGAGFIQTGKDLTELPVVIGTGGILAHGQCQPEILKGALHDPNDPESLKPKHPRLYLDRDYLLPTLGVIAETMPEAALLLLKGALAEI
jgi:uncharacterized protein (TIGR01319 family)